MTSRFEHHPVKYFLILIIAFFSSICQAQFRSDSLSPPIRSSAAVTQEIDWGRFGITAGVLAASITALHVLQYDAWWATDRGPFHIEDDPGYEKNFDKFG